MGKPSSSTRNSRSAALPSFLSASAPGRWLSNRGRTQLAVGAAVCILLAALLSLQADSSTRSVVLVSAASESKRWRGTVSQFGMGARKVPSVAELLTPAAPARSFYDSLRKDLRYLTSDSWSGMTGQFTTAVALIHLARRSQRVAVVPSWQDDTHYQEVVISMGLLFDLPAFRERTGSLVLEWTDVKDLDEEQKSSVKDTLGCYKGANDFMSGVSFAAHNLHQSIFPRPSYGSSEVKDSAEALMLFDFNEAERIAMDAAYAKEDGIALPRNLLDGQFMCFTSLWDIKQASGGYRTDAINSLLPHYLRGRNPEWWDVGQHINFSQPVWDVALDAVRRTIGGPLPANAVTVHLRRGDFQHKCGSTPKCLPGPNEYGPKVQVMLDRSPPGTIVLVTTDETKDTEFLDSIDQLGWYRINHLKLGTEQVLKAKFGTAYKWADAAVDQAILSLGDHFVGTEGSQVSIVSGQRVTAWHDGTFDLVGLVYNS